MIIEAISSEINACESLVQFLKIIKIAFTTTELKKKLLHHPDFPSLSAISDILTEYRLLNLATRLSPEQLHEIPLPALLHLEMGNDQYYAVVRKIEDVVEWYDTERDWQVEPFDDFIHKWSGVALLIEPNEQSGEENYTQNRRQEKLNSFRWLFLGAVSVLCMSAVLWHLFTVISFVDNTIYYASLITKFIGTCVCGMLVWYDIDSNNSFLKKLCQIRKANTCINILNSPVAKLTDWISWGEVGLFYFGGGLIVLLFCLLTSRTMDINLLFLFGLGVLALPYSFWSIYYQWRVAKQWCVLCLIVQVLLWCEAIIGYYLIKDIHFSFIGLPKILLSNSIFLLGNFIIVPTLWILFKPHLIKSIHFKTVERDLQRLKFNSDYLNALQQQKKLLPPFFEGMKVIHIGNFEAPHHLIFVSNPICVACRIGHISIEKILETNSNLRVTIILASPFDVENLASKISRQVLSLPTEQMSNALHSWFEKDGQRFSDWASKVGGDCNEDVAFKQLDLHLRWLELTGITSTPVSFLNSVELPKIYSPHEIPKLCKAFENKHLK